MGPKCVRLRSYCRPCLTWSALTYAPFRCSSIFCGKLLWLERDGLFGPELEFTVFVEFGFGLLAACDGDDVIEDALTHLVDRFGAVYYAACGEIEVIGHAFEHSIV